ncbi:MAG: hypothetical protein IPL65_20725 [Lewinellaceae bacterium]|nr:hypothetical protein [Lewinellaceae bacterium]
MNTSSNLSQLDDALDYQDIFGSLNSCNCEHCNSVLSPAAYFVDLIHYLKTNNTAALEELKERRPDLWNINLSCEETNSTKPYLQLIVEVLETYVVSKGNEKFPNAPDNIDDILYLPSLATETPFEYDHDRVKLLSAKLDISLFDIYAQMDVDVPFRTAEKIGLGPETLRWVIEGQPQLQNAMPKKYTVSDFITFFNLSPDELKALINTSIGKELSLTSEIISDNNGNPAGLIHYVLVNTTTGQPNKEAASYLKQIFTFVRIYKHLNYSIEQLDLYLSLSKTSQAFYSIEHMTNFSFLVYLKDDFGLADFELGLLRNGVSDSELQQLGSKFQSNDQVQLVKILQFLGITQSEFERLLIVFKKELEYSPEFLLINKKNFSLLKQNTIWAKAADMSIQEWQLFLNLQGIGDSSVKKMVSNNNWVELVKQIGKYKQSGVPIKLFDFYLNGIPNDEWSFSFTQEDAISWLTNLSVNHIQFADIQELSFSIATLLNSDSRFIKIIFSNWLQFLGEEDAPHALLEGLNKLIQKNQDDNSTFSIPGKELRATIALLRFLDKNLQLLSFIELTPDTTANFIEQRDSIGVPKNPTGFILGLCDYAKWMKGLQNNIEVFNYLFSSRENEILSDDFKDSIESILSIDLDSLTELNTLFEWKPLKLSGWNKFFNALKICKELKWTPKQLFEVIDVKKKDQTPRQYYSKLTTFFEQSIRNSNFSSEKQNEIFKVIDNKLLEQKRDVLVGVLKSPIFNFKSSAKIYEYFLLDVETSSCSEVSKIKAAILSTQLFIHRCLMSLEKHGNENIQFDAEAKDEWEWRKNYRVWEVNRKIFLYPENYLDPNLRDDKTKIFESLESDMQQRDLSKLAIQGVYHRYLKEFSTVAKLSMAGSFKDQENDIYYYFGRTTNKPYKYYYRTYKKQSRAWSPWHAINLNIDSGYLAGMVAYGRLYIFWKTTKVITKTEFENDDSGMQQSTTKSLKQIINYCYVEEDGSWSSPVIIDADINADVRLADLNPFDGINMEHHLNASPNVFDDYILLKRLNSQVYISFSNRIIFSSTITRLEAQVEIDIISHKFLSKSDGLDQQVPPSLAGYVTVTNNGIEIFRPAANFSEYYYINLLSKYSGSSSIGPIITSNRALSIINGQEIGNYVIDNGGMNYQYLTFNNGLYPLNSYVVTKLSNIIFSQGLDSFLEPETQLNTTEISHLQIADTILAPNNLFMPSAGLDFNGPNGIYFKELYFHIPVTLAKYYNQQQKYSEADYWYKKIFNPTVSNENGQKFWQYVPFRWDLGRQTKNILQDTAALEKYHEDPFNPHAIARLRTSSYPKAVVMGYIDNLLDWGDQLFSRDSYESINEAMMLYITAQQLLGQKPQFIVSCEATNESKTLSDIEESLNASNEILIEIESLNAENHLLAARDITSENILLNNAIGSPANNNQNQLQAFTNVQEATMSSSFVNDILFCIPWNSTLLQYWDRIEDRMFKIRNCMNIDGVYRQLALFEPPIDPMLLVRAQAAGIDIANVETLNTKLQPYRFNYFLEKARSYLSMVQSFGQSMLSTIEKQDGEALNELRLIHENNILQMLTLSKEKQLEKLQLDHVNIGISEEKTQISIAHIQELLGETITEGFKSAEKNFTISKGLHGFSRNLEFLSSIMFLFPDMGSPFSMKFGGTQMGHAMSLVSRAIGSEAIVSQQTGETIEKAIHQNIRTLGWQQQLASTEKELQAIGISKLVNEINMALGERDLQMHQQSISQNQEILDYYSQKLSNQALYNVLIGYLTSLFRDAYGLALQTALTAQKAFQFEVNTETSYVSVDNWNTASMGLLSAEKLQYQLMQMETAFLEQNKRKAEIRSHV